MTEPKYSYRGMMVRYWDLLRGDTSHWSSRPYFLKIIRESGEPALDAACGTGRLLLDYLAQDVDIDGVDISPEMIDACRVKLTEAGLSPNLYVQSMQDLELPRHHRTIIVPPSSFLPLTAVGDANRALLCFYEHMQPGGTLAISMKVFEPDPSAEEWEMIEEAVRPADGAVVRRWFRCRYDVPRRLQHTEDRYEILCDGEIMESEMLSASPYLTWYTVSEAVGLLQAAGSSDVHTHSDFTFEPASDEDTSFIVLGRRPE